MAKSKPPKTNHNKTNLWGMIRDICVASLNKGQFPIAIIGAIVLTIIIKMPGPDVSKLAFELVDHFVTFKVTGWFLSLSIGLGWYFNSKHLRKIHSSEMTRVSSEKKQIQEKALGHKLPSSNKSVV